MHSKAGGENGPRERDRPRRNNRYIEEALNICRNAQMYKIYREAPIYLDKFTQGKTNYVEEITIAHTLGVLWGWVREGGINAENLNTSSSPGRSCAAVRALEAWYRT